MGCFRPLADLPVHASNSAPVEPTSSFLPSSILNQEKIFQLSTTQHTSGRGPVQTSERGRNCGGRRTAKGCRDVFSRERNIEKGFGIVKQQLLEWQGVGHHWGCWRNLSIRWKRICNGLSQLRFKSECIVFSFVLSHIDQRSSWSFHSKPFISASSS